MIYSAGKSADAAEMLGNHGHNYRDEALNRCGAARQFAADLLGGKMLVAVEFKPRIACDGHNPSYDFHMATELRAFENYPLLCNQAAKIEDRARRIAVPGREPGDYKLWYWFDYDDEFSQLEVVDADRRHRGSALVLVSDWIDLSLLRTMKRYDKAGGKRLVRQIKNLLLGDPRAELTKAFCEAFFDNPANFG